MLELVSAGKFCRCCAFSYGFKIPGMEMAEQKRVLDGAWSNLVYWSVSLAGGLEIVDVEFPFQPKRPGW